METTVPVLFARAEALYRSGDHLGAVQALRELLHVDPAFFEADAVKWVRAFPVGETSHFWQPPADFYPASGGLRSVFDSIYQRAVWGDGSGGGSNLSNAVVYMAYLQAFMDRHDVRSVVDLGCGDWRFSRHLDFAGRSYIGFDIVESVVAANRAAYGNDNIEFRQADITAMEAIPSCDLFICKDVLQHLSNANVRRALAKFGSARFALITNDFHPQNVDCRDGATRPLNIAEHPFDFPARPVCRSEWKITSLAGA